MTQYYTNQLRGDGFGAQYQSLIYCILYAEVHCKGEFIYTKPNLESIYGNDAEKYEAIMNISKSYKSSTGFEDNIETLEFQKTRGVIEGNLDYFLNSETMKKLIFLFKQNKNVDIYDKNFKNIAIHIRRPSLHQNIDNISEHKEGWDKTTMTINELTNATKRFSPDSYYLNIINTIKTNNKSKKNRFHIISEGKLEDFANFNELNDEDNEIIFHLNEEVEKSFILMVMSDILTISCSSFSYTAALLNENKVIHHPDFWHKKSNKWF
jgi:hypothetical protein